MTLDELIEMHRRERFNLSTLLKAVTAANGKRGPLNQGALKTAVEGVEK